MEPTKPRDGPKPIMMMKRTGGRPTIPRPQPNPTAPATEAAFRYSGLKPQKPSQSPQPSSAHAPIPLPRTEASTPSLSRQSATVEDPIPIFSSSSDEEGGDSDIAMDISDGSEPEPKEPTRQTDEQQETDDTVSDIFSPVGRDVPMLDVSSSVTDPVTKSNVGYKHPRKRARSELTPRQQKDQSIGLTSLKTSASGRRYDVLSDTAAEYITSSGGVLFPDGYVKGLVSNLPYVCPIRTCRELYLTIGSLNKHWIRDHHRCLLNDNGDGTFSIRGRYAAKPTWKKRTPAMVVTQEPPGPDEPPIHPPHRPGSDIDIETQVATPKVNKPAQPADDSLKGLTMASASRPYNVWKDESGRKTESTGALFPRRYALSVLVANHPWICPIRSCRLLFRELTDLSQHFTDDHKQCALNDNGDGTFSVMESAAIRPGDKPQPAIVVSKDPLNDKEPMAGPRVAAQITSDGQEADRSIVGLNDVPDAIEMPIETPDSPSREFFEDTWDYLRGHLGPTTDIPNSEHLHELLDLPRVRDIVFHQKLSSSRLDRKSNGILSAAIHVTGESTHFICRRCMKGKGPFVGCIAITTHAPEEHQRAITCCSNCLFDSKETGCDLREFLENRIEKAFGVASDDKHANDIPADDSKIATPGRPSKARPSKTPVQNPRLKCRTCAQSGSHCLNGVKARNYACDSCRKKGKACRWDLEGANIYYSKGARKAFLDDVSDTEEPGNAVFTTSKAVRDVLATSAAHSDEPWAATTKETKNSSKRKYASSDSDYQDDAAPVVEKLKEALPVIPSTGPVLAEAASQPQATKSQSQRATTSPSLIASGQIPLASVNDLEMEEWEVAPGRIRSTTTTTTENIAFSNPYLTTGQSVAVNHSASFRIEIIRPGQTVKFTPDQYHTRIFSLATGKLKIRVGDEPEFAIGTHGMFKMNPGVACAVENRLYIDSILHVTSMNSE